MTGVRWVPRQAIVLFLAAAIVLSVPAAPAAAAIGQDAPTSNYGQTSTLTWQHTVGTGSYRLLLVGISMDTPSRSLDSVTYGGTALTLVGARSGNATRVEIWGLKDPASGTADVVAHISDGSSEWMAGGAVSYSGVSPATPWSGFVSAAGIREVGDLPSLTVSSGSGQLVFDTIAINDDQIGSYDASVGAGQTSLWNVEAVGQSLVGAASTEPGASSTDMTWDFGTADYIWAYGAVAIHAAGPPYRPDLQVKLGSEAAGSYATDNLYETTASTQVKSQGILSGSAAAYNLLIQNDGEESDSFVIAQAAAVNCTNFTVQYLDQDSIDRTASVTGAGYTLSGIALIPRTWTLNVTPPASLNGSGPACAISVTATSAGDGTKTDQVKAVTSSASANIALVKITDRITVPPGQDIVYTVNATSGSGLTDASSVVLTDPVPTHTGFKVGSASFSPGTSTLSGTAVYSNDSVPNFTYTPASGGCSAPSGYDYCVTYIRWTTTGSMPPGTGFSVSFTVGVK